MLGMNWDMKEDERAMFENLYEEIQEYLADPAWMRPQDRKEYMTFRSLLLSDVILKMVTKPGRPSLDQPSEEVLREMVFGVLIHHCGFARRRTLRFFLFWTSDI